MKDNRHCPVCGSTHIERDYNIGGDYVEVGENVCWQHCWCDECESEWVAVYKFDCSVCVKKGD